MNGKKITAAVFAAALAFTACPGAAGNYEAAQLPGGAYAKTVSVKTASADNTAKPVTSASAAKKAADKKAVWSKPSDAKSSGAKSTEAKDFSDESAAKLIYGDKCVFISEITDAEKFFGEPETPEIKAPSCLGEGEDVMYCYDDFTVCVFVPKKGTAKVMSVTVTGKSVKNPKGLYAGMKEKKALSLLGDREYEDEGVTVSFLAEDGVVTQIEYTLD
ncbi:MAG: hypothetical protein NC078_07645 [Ruminococcus sp.]|nr:hypothetical protein [Ruminococcus sp.]